MKYDVSLWDKLSDLEQKEKVVYKDLYIRFSITGWKVTLSRDLRESLFKNYEYITFKTHKEIDTNRGNRKDGTPFYKHQYLGIEGSNHDGATILDQFKTRKIETKGKDEDTNKYYYVNLSKSIFADIDKSLINTTSHVSSRQYKILEESINSENGHLIIDMENRSKKVFSVGYKNGYNKDGKIDKKDNQPKDKAEETGNKESGVTMGSLTTNSMGTPQLK